jgi:hypothetical protein
LFDVIHDLDDAIGDPHALVTEMVGVFDELIPFNIFFGKMDLLILGIFADVFFGDDGLPWQL